MRILEDKVSFEELSKYLNSLCGGHINKSVLDWIQDGDNESYYIFYMDIDGKFYSNTVDVISPESIFHNDEEVYFRDGNYAGFDDYGYDIYNEPNDDFDEYHNYDLDEDHNYHYDDGYDDEYDDDCEYDIDEDSDYNTENSEKYFPSSKEIKGRALYQFEDVWREVDKIDVYARCLNTRDSLMDYIKKNKPYLYKLGVESKHPEYFLISPWLEQLCKSGYAFASKIVNNVDPDNILYFYSMTKRGSDIKHIIKTEKPIYDLLRNEEDLYIWYMFTRLYKEKLLKKEEMPFLYAQKFNHRELDTVRLILAERCVTIKKLVNLLSYSINLDKEGRETELILFYDSIFMARKYYGGPDTSYGSIKKRHDKLLKQHKMEEDKKLDMGIRKSWEYSKRLDFSSGDFFIRAARDAKDLLDEATQQDNCVFVVYGEMIADGETMIFFMRRKEAPDKSLITVELKDGTIKQASLSQNREITNDDQIKFLELWEEYVSKILLKEKKKVS